MGAPNPPPLRSFEMHLSVEAWSLLAHLLRSTNEGDRLKRLTAAASKMGLRKSGYAPEELMKACQETAEEFIADVEDRPF